MINAFKVFASDLRSPLQGGAPVWDGSLPYDLPVVRVDESNEECAAGWNACRTPDAALRIAGLWPDGRATRVFAASTIGKVIERGDKLRAATWRIERELAEPEVRAAVLAMSVPFGDLAEEITEEQMLWRSALSGERRDHVAVEAGLMAALAARGLPWALRQYPDVRAAWDARAAWYARDARAAVEAARAARAAMAVRAAGEAARDAGEAARAAWDAKAAWAAWDVRDAWGAWGALTHWYAVKRGWVSGDPSKYTIGIRDAYSAGLAVAIPVDSTTMGWAMRTEEGR